MRERGGQDLPWEEHHTEQEPTQRYHGEEEDLVRRRQRPHVGNVTVRPREMQEDVADIERPEYQQSDAKVPAAPLTMSVQRRVREQVRR